MYRTELRRHLGKLFNLGPAARPRIDKLQKMSEACPADDLQLTFEQATTGQLLVLRKALVDGRCVRRTYNLDAGHACIVSVLLGFCSNQEFLEWDVADHILLATSRTMRRWDYEALSIDFVLFQIEVQLERRRLVHKTMIERTSIDVCAGAAETVAL